MHTPSHVSMLITNLKLLDLDLLDDWPSITLQTFSAHNWGQVERQRVQCVEWALYRLFERWDPEGTTNKLQPFFPPLEPLQSLNLRVALFRCLSDLKKQDLLGKDIMLRKTTLDECKGDKLEELLGAFSTLVLRKVIAAEATGKERVVRRLSLSRKLAPEDQALLQPLVIAHRVSLTTHLRKNGELKSRVDDFDRVLNVKKQELDRKAQSLQHTSDDRASEASKEGEAVRRSISRATIKLKRDAGKQWKGDPAWVATILEGPRKGDQHDADDVVLDAPFDRVWSECIHGNTDEKESQNDTPSFLLRDLENRVARQQNRLQRWRTLRKDMAHRKPAHSFAENDKNAPPGAFDPNSRKQEKGHGHRAMEEATGMKVKNEGKASSADLGGAPDARRASDARTASAGAPAIGRIPAHSADRKEGLASPIRRSSIRRLPIRSHIRSSQSGIPSPENEGLPSSQLTQISGTVLSEHPVLTAYEHVVSRHPQRSITVCEVDNTTCAIQETLSPLYEDDVMAQHIISSVINAKPSPVKAKHSLIERTRISMGIPSSDIAEVLEPRPPSKKENVPKKATTDLRISSISLLERTRQSMSILPAKAREPQKLRQSQSFPINQFVTPRKQQPNSNNEESGKDSTPRELLFAEEADYTSVFKSRPRIKISPISSPMPHEGSRLDNVGEDYESAIMENSPSRRATARV